MKKSVLFLCLLIASGFNAYPQEKMSVILSAGSSTFREINNSVTQIGNYYTSITSYKTGIQYDFFRQDSVRFFPSFGLDITVRGAKNNLPDGMVWHGTDKSYINERFFSVDFPVLLNYKFEDWLIFRGGINTSLLTGTSNFQGGTEKRLITIGLTGGGTIKVNRFTINALYIYDLSNSLTFPNLGISYRSSIFHLGVGYYFDSFKFKRGFRE